jgi:hypothetical protein
LKPLRITNDGAQHIFVECFCQYEAIVEADPDLLADETQLQDYLFDFNTVASRVLSPVELKLFKMRIKYGKKPADCRDALQLSWNAYQYMKKRIRIKLGRGLLLYRLWPVDKYFNDNHERKVQF